MSKTYMIDFMLVVDDKHHIISIFPTESNFSSSINLKVEKIVEQDSLEHFKVFMKILGRNQAALNHEVALNYENKTYDCHLNGYKDGNVFVIFALFNTSSDEEVFKKMMLLNSQQVNELRILRKELQKQDTNVYEEMSKLNSELLNSKRIIEKQNAELQRYNSLLKQMSIEDSLTGSYNRRYFYDYMKETILSSQKYAMHSLIMIDFNNFKQVNDQFGHDAGDRLLIIFVKLTKDIIKGHGEIFRIGGDEFIIILNGTNQEEALTHMKRIETQFSSSSTVVTLAYGIVEFNESEINHEFDLSNLVDKADTLMYKDKGDTKNTSR